MKYNHLALCALLSLSYHSFSFGMTATNPESNNSKTNSKITENEYINKKITRTDVTDKIQVLIDVDDNILSSLVLTAKPIKFNNTYFFEADIKDTLNYFYFPEKWAVTQSIQYSSVINTEHGGEIISENFQTTNSITLSCPVVSSLSISKMHPTANILYQPNMNDLKNKHYIQKCLLEVPSYTGENNKKFNIEKQKWLDLKINQNKNEFIEDLKKCHNETSKSCYVTATKVFLNFTSPENKQFTVVVNFPYGD